MLAQDYAHFATGGASIEITNSGSGRRETLELELAQGIWDTSFPACLADTRCPAVPSAMTLVFWQRFMSGGVEQTQPVLLLAGRAETGTFVTTADGDLYVGINPTVVGIGTADEYGYQSSRMGGQCTVTLGGSFELGLAGSVECAGLGPGPLGDFVDATGTFSTGPGVGSPPAASAPVASASPSTSAFGVGIACGVREDAGLRLLACTASPFGQAADAELAYEWRVDGVKRPETGSTMQVDIVRENLPAGSHAIGVTVTDTRHGVQATNSTAVETTTAAFTVSLTCTYSESQGTDDLTCSAWVANPPPNADLTYSWTVNGAPAGGNTETLTRSVGQGPVQVTVSARDSVSGQQTSTASFFLTINPAGTLTNMLTLGQTSDPQNVIDALAGSAVVALVVGAAAAVGGALAGVAGAASGAGPAPPGSGTQPVPASGAAATPKSGVVGGDVVDSVELVAQIVPEPPWALPEAPPTSQPSTQPPTQAPPSQAVTPSPGPGPTGAQFVDSQVSATGVPSVATPADFEDLRLAEELFTSPGSGSPAPGASPSSSSAAASSPPTTGAAESVPTDARIAQGVGDMLAAEAGQVPSPADVERWRTLSGFPNTPEGTFALQSHLSQLNILQAAGKNPDTDLFLKMLRERAQAFRPENSSAVPPAEPTPNPDKP